jgi:hypothetical protein
MSVVSSRKRAALSAIRCWEGHARQYWTLSVWEDETALQAFVAENPHSDIMSAMARDMGATQFVRWHLQGSSVPPTWDEALRRIEENEALS